MFCIWAAIVAGFGLATVLALGTASITAAVAKSQVSIDSPVHERVKAAAPTVKIVAAVGFVVGASVVVWMFWSTRPPKKDPAEGVENTPAEV